MASITARDARDQGIAVADSHADRVNPEWRDRAYDALLIYAQTHPTFTIEQLRVHLNGQLEDPPSLRAWGGVAQRAHRAGVIEHYGWTEAEDPAVHCNVIRVWRSRLTPAEAAHRRTPFRLVESEPSAEFGDLVNAGISIAGVRDLERRLAITTTALRHVYQNLLLIDPAAPWRIRNQSVFAACCDGIAHAEKVDPQIVQDVAEEAARQRRYELDAGAPPTRWREYLVDELVAASRAAIADADGMARLEAALVPFGGAR